MCTHYIDVQWLLLLQIMFLIINRIYNYYKINVINIFLSYFNIASIASVEYTTVIWYSAALLGLYSGHVIHVDSLFPLIEFVGKII